MFADDRAQIEAKLGRRAGSALRVHERMQRMPFLKIPDAANELGLSKPTVGAAIEALRELDIVRQPLPR